MNIKELTRKLGKIYPKSKSPFKEDFIGFVSGIKPREEIKSVIICLDVDHEVVTQALERKVDLIISHHPFLFGRKNEVLKDPIKNDLYQRLFQNKIAVYSLHTNFDIAPEGMNVALLKKLELKNILKSENSDSFLYTGELAEEMEIEEFAEHTRRCLELPYLTLKKGYCGTHQVKKVGLIAGSGASEYLEAKKSNVDVFITGEVKLNQRQEMFWRGINLIEVPHEVERIFTSVMSDILNYITTGLEVITINNQTLPKIFIAGIK